MDPHSGTDEGPGTARPPYPRGMTESLAAHWDDVYGSKQVDAMSWFQPSPDTSLRLLAAYAEPGSPLVDVGAGASSLADALLDAGWSDLTVLDVSARAVDLVRVRLGERASAVDLVVVDIREWRPARTFGAWHDRAVFHFLVDADDRARYAAAAAAAVAPGGVLVVATFAEDGPEQCSGLPTRRYDAEALAAELGVAFDAVHAEREQHVTPWGVVQPFTWVVLRRR